MRARHVDAHPQGGACRETEDGLRRSARGPAKRERERERCIDADASTRRPRGRPATPHHICSQRTRAHVTLPHAVQHLSLTIPLQLRCRPRTIDPTWTYRVSASHRGTPLSTIINTFRSRFQPRTIQGHAQTARPPLSKPFPVASLIFQDVDAQRSTPIPHPDGALGQHGAHRAELLLGAQTMRSEWYPRNPALNSAGSSPTKPAGFAGVFVEWRGPYVGRTPRSMLRRWTFRAWTRRDVRRSIAEPTTPPWMFVQAADQLRPVCTVKPVLAVW